MKNKILTIGMTLVAAVLLVCVCVGAANAAVIDSGKCGDNLTWTFTDDGTLTISGTGAMYDYQENNGSTTAPWYQYRSQMTKLVLEEGMTTIGNYAFFRCRDFTGSLVIPNSVITIGDWAFSNFDTYTCTLVLSNNLTTIGDWAFNSNHNYFTGSLILPNTLTTIGEGAFHGCGGFTGSLIIPNSVTKIGDSVFWGCEGFTGSLTIPNNVTTLGHSAFEFCRGFTGSLTLPNNITTIGASTFTDCGFTGELIIPNSVTWIGNDAFSRCRGFTGSLIIPNNVTTIGVNAFSGCSGFTGTLTIPENVKAIYDGAFSGCSGLTDIIVDSKNQNYSSDDQGVLYNKDKTTLHTCLCSKNGSFITIPDSVTTIFGQAFAGCGFTGPLTIPNNVTEIGNGAFFDCGGFTGSLTIPNNLRELGNCAFYRCSGLTSVFIPGDIRIIGFNPFDYLSPNSVLYAESPKYPFSIDPTSIDYSTDKTALAIHGENNAYTFTVDSTFFPSGFPLTDANVPVISGKTFEGWYTNPSYTGDKVTTVSNGQTLYAKWNSKPGIIDSGKCGDHLTWTLTNDGTLTISGTGKMYDYVNTGGPWKKYASQLTRLVLSEGMTSIGHSAFINCDTFTGQLVLPSTLESIEPAAFKGCTGFTGPLTIPNGVKTIDRAAFEDCTGFNGPLLLPDSLKRIVKFAFYGCSGISGVLVIPEQITSIDVFSFYDCNSFTSVILPPSVEVIGSCSFINCSGLTHVTIPEGVKKIEDQAFEKCTALCSLTIPASVQEFEGASIFYRLHEDSVIYAECNADLMETKHYDTRRTAVAAAGANNAYQFTVDSTYFPNGFPLSDANAPEKEGMVFEGWYTNPSYTGDKITTVSNGQTLYAKWSSNMSSQYQDEDKSTVTYNRGHSASIPKDYTPSSSVPVMVQETAKPTTAPTVAAPTVMPTTKPTTQQTQKSPAPFVGLIAGLGIAGLVLSRLRK